MPKDRVDIPMQPSEPKATTVESFICWNCGMTYPTEGKNEGLCPVCGKTCSRDRCRVVGASNEGY